MGVKRQKAAGSRHLNGGGESAFFMDLNTGLPGLFSNKFKRGDIHGKLGIGVDGNPFVAARHFFKATHLVQHFAAARLMFLNSGFTLRAADGKKASADKLQKWLHPVERKEREQRKLLRRLHKFVADALTEWIVMDCAVAFWREANPLPATLLAPEECLYSDEYGLEKLISLKRNDPEKMKAAGFSEEQIKRYSTGRVELSEQFDEYFAVVKRERQGFNGLGEPRLRAFWLALHQLEGMEAGEAVVGHLARLVIRHHKLGHDPKTGIKYQPRIHGYTEEKATAIKNKLGNKHGFVEFASQFDHEITDKWVDTDWFKSDKWKTVVDRLTWWGGAVVRLYLAETLRPYLLGMLREEVLAERALVKDWLEEVINASFPVPCGVRVEWGVRCFNEPRVANEMMNALLQAGPLSQTTALTEAGYDVQTERANKEAEAKLPPAQTHPLFDPAHGETPGKPGGNGRPAGTPNPDDA